MSNKDLVEKIVMFRTELERQNAGMGIMSLFDTICSYYGEQHRTIESLQKENDYNGMLIKSFRDQIDREQAVIEDQNALIESQKEEIEEFKEFQSEVADEYNWMNRLLNSYLKSENRLITEIESLKAITELKMASEHDKLGGWTLDYAMISQIQKSIERYDDAPSMEGVELVLLAFHGMKLPNVEVEDGTT